MSGISLLHRHVWQRLPYRWRRAALFGAAARTAPRPTDGAPPALPFIVAGTLRTASGLGQSARLCHEALKAAGLPVFGIDLTAALRQTEDVPDFTFACGRGIEGPGTLIVHVNAPVLPLAMLRLGRRAISQKRVIGYWAWELPAVPPDWRHGVPFVHEIWTPSTFVAEAMSPLAAGRPVRTVPHPVAVHRAPGGSTRKAASRDGRPFTVLTVFNMASGFARKNPCASVAAFRLAFGDGPGVRLIVKTANASAFPDGFRQLAAATGGAANIVLDGRTLSTGEMAALYGEADAVISLHRSEGFGLILAEAMLHGLPAVATDWSGNADFLTARTGLPIPWRPVPAEDPQATYHYPAMTWAEPDIAAAAGALRRLRGDPGLCARLGEEAARFAARAWSGESYAAAVLGHLGLSGKPSGAAS